LLRTETALWLPGLTPPLPPRPPSFPAGQELADDSITVSELDLRTSRHVLMVQLSQLDNSFTMHPHEFREQWEGISPEWMLSHQVGARAAGGADP
jgi:hypothetical protein